jgi:hypothetical protein
MAGSVNKIDHLGCCKDRQRMMSEAGLGEMKAAISRARSSCLTDASASNEITRFSSAITRTRS